jgi:hypothetical protein
LQASPASRIWTLIAASLVAVPAILFYAILFRESLNLPLDDDYGAFLNFLNQLVQLKSVPAKISYFLASQHAEYKLFFIHGLAWLQFDLCGHIDFKLLCAIGNGFVLLLAILLWKMFLPNHKDLASRLAFFVPVSWLLFQLQYYETLDWAMGALQNISVLVFSLGTIYLLVRTARWAYCCAVLSFVLAVASSGNGFLMIPVGVLILLAERRYARIASWLAVSAGCVAAYAYHYDVMSSQSSVHESVFATLLRPRPLFVVAFMGNAAGFPYRNGCLVLGFALCLFFVFLALRGYIRKNPAVFYCVLFLLLTAVGVAGLRSDLGLAASLAPRYTIYSALLMIFAWFGFVEEFLQHWHPSVLGKGVLLGAVTAAILFSLSMDRMGMYRIETRNRLLIQAITAFEHSISPEPTIGLVLLPLPWQNRAQEISDLRNALDLRARAILTQSIQLGVYRPPSYSSADTR